MSELPDVRSDSLGGSALSQAGRAGRLPEWFVTPPRGSDAWKQYARGVIDSVPASWLESLSSAIDARGAAAERLSRSAGGKGLVVTTGQQPGLFGGPLMTFVKALSARALADVLEEAVGMPVAPVFWAATDDADFDEAAHVSVALDGGARELRLEDITPAGTPMSRVPIGADVAHLAAVLREACGSAPHSSYLERSLAAYREGATVGEAYVRVLRDVLEPLGIAVFDVSHPSVATVTEPVLRRAAERTRALAGAVRDRDAQIVEAGFRPQVDAVSGLSLVFLNEQGTKRRLTESEAVALGTLGGGQSLSSTVLLRPVLERAMFPTAAYVAGPGELAYFAQVTAVADALDLPRPLVVPRWSTTIIEPRIQRLLHELGVTVESLSDVHAVERRLAHARMPAEAQAALRALRENLARDVASLGDRADGLVPSEVIDGARRNIEHRLARLERRLIAGVKRRETDLMSRIATARGALHPHGARQERKLAWVPFLARHGPQLVEQMLNEARAHARSIVAGTPSLASAAAPARV